ncbi:hypothetical protein CLIB1423_19S02608 [[Candida] railenensis]|uniref:Uncharacterized protein n=1 Tax=[Candida] railenensis TaxID=45579 RepID=A0A9P0W0R2_9ASCO|nr:hypothetical protein CLIB1423_19S02608 [[Candida] railenensis]
MESDEELFAPNSSLLKIIPSLIKDLFYYEESSRLLSRFLQSDVSGLTQQRIEGLNPALRSLAIDEDKSVMLTLMLGRLFIDAFEMLMDKCVEFEVCVEEIENKGELVQNYLSGDFNSKVPILVTAKQKMSPFPSSKRVNEEPIDAVRHRVLINELARLEAGDQEASPPDFGIYQVFSVDLKSWYCNCDEYQDQMADNSENHPEAYRKEKGEFSLKSMEEIISQSRGASGLLLDILTSSEIPTRHKSPLPLCSHLLAVIICSYNRKIELYRVK